MSELTTTAAFDVKGLTYAFPDSTVGLQDVNIDLPSGSRTLLVGANGAGKSTLLRILAGKTLSKTGSVRIYGFDPFRTSVTGVTYLGTEWAANPVVRHDMPVPVLLASVGGDAFPDRRDQLLDILDVDLRWHMHAVSDGERRRVQLVMGLLRPWNILMLDEVTVDLDVLVRARLLSFLRTETESRPCAILYATHIFDGLADWPSHLLHIHLGRILSTGRTTDIIAKYLQETADQDVHHHDKQQQQLVKYNNNSALLNLALAWLSSDLADRGARETVKKLKWEDVSPEDKQGGLSSFEEYFKFSRAR
ncbi:P-loop containing nucleoside triphosphate hydrolase protein [Lipomyces japonicus]|uniref:P-loop containing nucleoside triphosphate hydrolase protein n=1 Tax=Lipomyces japonicus TaxID=56871 RepID=UPI0034CEC648